MTVSVRQAQLELAQLIDRSACGEEVIISTEDGRSAARLVPTSVSTGPLRPGFLHLQGKVEIVADDEEHLKDFAEYM